MTTVQDLPTIVSDAATSVAMYEPPTTATCCTPSTASRSLSAFGSARR